MTTHRPAQPSMVVDRFDRKPFAKQLATIIRKLSTPKSMTLGIYGPWGDGKTTLLDYMVDELSEDVILVPFNPWLYSNETELLDQFFKCLGVAFREQFKQGEKAERLLDEYRSFVLASHSVKDSRVRVRRDVKQAFQWAKKYLAFVAAIPGGIGTGIWTAINDYAAEPPEDRKENVNQELLYQSKRIVIVIDDIDRLENHCIHALFKLIRLIADFPYTCYVMAFDEEMVAQALNERYSDKSGQPGRKFIDKIIQVPLHLPKAADYQLVDYLWELLLVALGDLSIKLTPEQERIFGDALIEVLLVRLTTPRSCERYVNALSFLLPLTYGEVNIIDAMILEGCRLLFPELYLFIRTGAELIHPPVHSRLAWDQDFHMECLFMGFEKATKEYTVSERAAARRLFLSLLPMFVDDDIRKNGWFKKANSIDSSDWLTEKRLASDFYFHRYFAYAVSSTDMSDVAIDGLLREANRCSVKGLIEAIDLLTDDEAKAGNFILKLSARASDIPVTERRKFALAVALSGKKYLQAGILRRSRFYKEQAWEQAIRFILVMLENGHSSDRSELFPELISSCNPLLFLIRIFWRLPKVGDPNRTNADFKGYTTDEIKAFGELLVERRIIPEFEANINSEDLLTIRGSINVWGTYAKAGLNNRLQMYFNNPTSLLTVLSCYLGDENDHWIREPYDEMVKAIDAQLIRSSIESLQNEPAFQSIAKRGTRYAVAVKQFMEINNHIIQHEITEIQ